MKTYFLSLLFAIITAPLCNQGSLIQKSNCKKEGQSLQDYFRWRKDTKKEFIMAHRTSLPSSFGLPENSLEALLFIFKNYPCAIPEVDVRMSKDSILLLLHDPKLNRTTTGSGYISQMLYKDIKKLSLKDESNKIFPDKKIPTLQEVLSSVNRNRIIFLDVKPGIPSELLMHHIERSKTINNVVVICYTMEEAIKLNKKFPTLMLALGFNWERMPLIEKSGIPHENLIALLPYERQEDRFYDKIHEMGIMTSFNANGGLDTLKRSEALNAYKNVWKKNEGGIICTDSLIVASQALNN